MVISCVVIILRVWLVMGEIYGCFIGGIYREGDDGGCIFVFSDSFWNKIELYLMG